MISEVKPDPPHPPPPLLLPLDYHLPSRTLDGPDNDIVDVIPSDFVVVDIEYQVVWIVSPSDPFCSFHDVIFSIDVTMPNSL